MRGTDRQGGATVVDVAAPDGPLPPWGGIGLVLDAVRAIRRAPVPLSLDAAASGAGHVVGDHLGLGADLAAVLAELADAGPVEVVVRDVHRFDLTSAAALAFALERAPAGVRAVGLPDEGAPGCTGAGDAGEPGVLAGLGAALDAACAAERSGDLVGAAGWWLEGGRPGRCAAALDAAGGPSSSPAAAGLAARLAHATRDVAEWRAAVREASVRLERVDPLEAARLLLLDAAALVDHGALEGARDVLGRSARVLDASGDDRERRPVADLHVLLGAAAETTAGAPPDQLLGAVERPLARLGTSIDGDAVRHVTAAARALGWSGHLPDARALLDRLTGVLHGRRRLLSLPAPLAASAWLARRRSRLDVALVDGTRAVELARAAGARNDLRFAMAEVAHVEALQGRLDACRGHVAELVPDGVPRDAVQLAAVSALAVGELLADRPDAAARLLEPVHAGAAGEAAGHTAWHHNLVEAHARTGRRHDAAVVVGDLERWAARGPSPRERGIVLWCRSMLAPREGVHELVAQAAELLRPYPALRWRCEASHLRRMLDDGRRADAASLARHLLEDAVPSGVPAGADHVARLLARHGLEPVPVRSDTSQLSVDDLRIAIALVEGADDDEIAGRMHVSTRGVDGARERVLSALGVDAVAQLEALVALDTAEPGTTPAEVRILGPTLVARSSRHSVPPPGRPATLLALVAAEGGATVDRALDVLWPDDDPTRSRPRLRNVLARLKAAVGPVVSRQGEVLVLDPGVVVDAHRFDALAQRALRADPAELEEAVEQAIAAWTGLPLPAWPYEDWASGERRRLVQRAVAVLVRRADLRAASDDAAAALDDLELAITLDPEAPELWQRAVDVAEADERVGRARALRRRAADRGVDLLP